MDFGRAEWNSLVTEETIPFLEWEWLAALEKSGSAGPKTGWCPLHPHIREGGKLLAAAPFYLKNHSEGEFIWDHFWAEAAFSLGRNWYPKLVGTIPATPAEGYRFLTAEGEDPRILGGALLDAAENLCRRQGIRGIHILFADPSWASLLEERSYRSWKHSRFIWENALPRAPGVSPKTPRPDRFASFEEFLSLFNKNQRKNIRKEYRRHEEQGIHLRILPGEAAEADCFNRIFELYSITNDKFIPWDARWVNGDFFRLLGEYFRPRTLFSQALLGEETLALAMMFRKGDRLWGRYWGSYGAPRDLHFAACYYAPMDYCIREGIRLFDPGLGSSHKIRRGFRAALDRSWHVFFDPVLEGFFTAAVKRANRLEEETMEALNAEIPFKEGPLPFFQNSL
jgi:predicted N-acyltransferase